jgi:phenylpropionate dioxygenase-like ring-hydroxylating dioxygenase large terminal subunit
MNATHEPTRLLDPADVARARAPLPQSWTLPPAAYTDPRIFEIERDAVFGRDWLCVARQEQLPRPGDFLCVDLPDQPIVVVRDRSGELHALSRVCIHRAMPVIEGSGNATRFVCPYHHWTYELDGALRSAPMMDGVEGFDAAACRLPALRLEAWQGFVFVNRDPQAAPLAPQLEGLAKALEPYQYDRLQVVDTIEFDSPWNWKILVENFMEAYHHIGPHRNTFEPVYPARRSLVEDNGGAPWTLLRMPGIDTDGTEDATTSPGRDETAHQLLAANVYPTLLFAVSDTGAAWYQLEPRAHDAMNLKIHYLMPPEAAGALDAEGRAATMEFVRAIHVEDISVNEGPWRGLHAGLTAQGRLSLFEGAIWQLNQLWLDRIEPCLPAT